MRSIRPGTLPVVLSATLLLAGCGSGRLIRSSHASAASTSPTSVIRSWTNDLRRGDVAAAARYFALPSEFANGPTDIVAIRTEADAITVNSGLSCGSVLISTHQEGHFTNAVFRLTNRTGPGADCGSGVGALASTDFLIRDGHIVEWIRAPDPTTTGPNTVPAVPTPTSPTPASAI